MAYNNGPAKTFVVAAALTLSSVIARGQAIDPSIGAVDSSVSPRVQDSDHPVSPLFPGASGPWTGELNVTPASASAKVIQTGASRANQFPSLSGTSSWGGVSSSASNTQSTATPSPSTTTMQTRNPLLNTSQWNRLSTSQKKALVLAAAELAQGKTNRATDEFSIDKNESSDQNAKLRMLKRATQKTARAKIVNPFQNKADATNVGRWRGTVLTASSLEEQRHNEASLVLHGYETTTERKRHRRHHHGASTSPGTH